MCDPTPDSLQADELLTIFNGNIVSNRTADTLQAEDLMTTIRTLDSKFRRSCDEILLLNNQIEELQIRYDRAMGSNRRSFRYSIRLRLATLEGVRNMFYEYASRCADKLEVLQNELIGAGGEPYVHIDGEWEPVTSSDEEGDNTQSIQATATAAAPGPQEALNTTYNVTEEEMYTEADEDQNEMSGNNHYNSISNVLGINYNNNINAGQASNYSENNVTSESCGTVDISADGEGNNTLSVGEERGNKSNVIIDDGIESSNAETVFYNRRLRNEKNSSVVESEVKEHNIINLSGESILGDSNNNDNSNANIEEVKSEDYNHCYLPGLQVLNRQQELLDRHPVRANNIVLGNVSSNSNMQVNVQHSQISLFNNTVNQ